MVVAKGVCGTVDKRGVCVCVWVGSCLLSARLSPPLPHIYCTSGHAGNPYTRDGGSYVRGNRRGVTGVQVKITASRAKELSPPPPQHIIVGNSGFTPKIKDTNTY